MPLDSVTLRPATNMTLADFTDPGLVISHLRGEDAPSVIQELSLALHRERRIPEMLPFYLAALNREYMVSTHVEAGMALPHARLSGLQELSFAIGRSDASLPWGGTSTGGVRLVFLSAVPATDSTQYLALISGLARLAKDGRLVEKLLSAQDSLQMLEVLKQVDLRIRNQPWGARKATP